MSLRAIGEIFKTGANLVDDLVTTKEELAKAEFEYYKVDAQLAEKQLEVNQTEAQHKSLFVAGWRPFVGWVCGLSLAYNFIVRDFMAYFINMFFNAPALPHIQMEQLITVLLGMLGLAGYRTFEKTKGVSSDTMNTSRKK